MRAKVPTGLLSIGVAQFSTILLGCSDRHRDAIDVAGTGRGGIALTALYPSSLTKTGEQRLITTSCWGGIHHRFFGTTWASITLRPAGTSLVTGFHT